MIEDGQEQVRRATIDALGRRLNLHLALAAGTFLLLIVFLQASPDRWIGERWLRFVFAVVERLVIGLFCVNALVLAPMVWFHRRALQLSDGSSADLPKRYRVRAWSLVVFVVAGVIVFVWYSVAHGLTKL